MPDFSLPDDRIRAARLANGFTQGDLAKAAGVSRQAVSGIESGRWSPSLEVALALARTLNVSVEDLFGQSVEALSIVAELAVDTPTGGAVTRRVLLSDVAGQTVAFPLARDGSLVPGFVPAFGVVREGVPDVVAEASATGKIAARLEIAPVEAADQHAGSLRAHRICEAMPTLAVAGCDPALPLLQGPLSRHKPAVGLVWWPCGNDMALELLARGAVHAAAIHRRLDAKWRPEPEVEVVGFASWREGLALCAPQLGNVRDLRDVVAGGLRVANRERGSEARRLFDRELRQLGVDSKEVSGYNSACTAHLLVASAIGSGLADVGVTTEPAAMAFGLGFVPWSEEVCELHIPKNLMGSVEVRALRDVLGGRELPRQLAALDGYDPDPCGRVLVA